MKNRCEEIHLSNSTTERDNCVRVFGISCDKHLNNNFYFTEVGRKQSKSFSVLSPSQNYGKKPVVSGTK